MHNNITKSLVTLLSSIVLKMACPDKKSRKPNFIASEISVLTEKYEENMEILQSKLTNSVTNAKKNQVWDNIAAAVNADGVAPSTTQEVKDKWKNLQSIDKKEFSGFKNERKKTGGGLAPPNPSEATLKIIDMFCETPSFTGLQGFETGRFSGGNIYLLCIFKMQRKTN